MPLKKRRLVSGRELVFRRPGEEDSDEDDDGVGPMPQQGSDASNMFSVSDVPPVPIVDASRITIIEDD